MYLSLLIFAAPTVFKLIYSVLHVFYVWFVFKLKPRPSFISPETLGQWAVITGSTDGIGLEYARQLGRLRFNLVLISRSEDKLDKVSTELRVEMPSIQVRTIQADFGDHGPSLYERIERDLGSATGSDDGANLDIAVLVNNVGVSYERLFPLQKITPEMIDKIIQVNVASVMQMTRMILPHMLNSKSSKNLIVNMSSASGLVTIPYLTAYAASKSAILSFSKALKQELVESKVIVQCVYPGFVATKMMTGGRADKKPRDKWFVISAEHFVKQAMNSVGSLSFTSGCFSHYLHAEILNANVPIGRLTRHTKQKMVSQENKFKRKISVKQGLNGGIQKIE